MIMAYAYNGILFNNRKEWSVETCYSIYGLWKYTKWKVRLKYYITLFNEMFNINKSMETENKVD
jgi:hypothetical protein